MTNFGFVDSLLANVIKAIGRSNGGSINNHNSNPDIGSITVSWSIHRLIKHTTTQFTGIEVTNFYYNPQWLLQKGHPDQSFHEALNPQSSFKLVVALLKLQVESFNFTLEKDLLKT